MKEATKRKITKVGVASIPVAIIAIIFGVYMGATHVTNIPTPSLDNAIGKTSVSSSDADNTVVASYKYDGNTYNVTQGDVNELFATDDVKNDTVVGSADNVLSTIRQKIVSSICDSEQINTSDEYIKKYATHVYGSDDYDKLADTYKTSSSRIKQAVTAAAHQAQLFEKVTGVDPSDSPLQPTQPSDTSDAAKATLTDDYAKYIKESLGRDWSSSQASFNDAVNEYNAAAKDYQSKYKDAQTKWNNYINDVYSKVTVNLYTLAQ